MLQKEQMWMPKQTLEELEGKIHTHRVKFLKIMIAAVLIGFTLCGGLYIYFHSKTYVDYQVIHSHERKDSLGTDFLGFNGAILKYSNDGIQCFDESNTLIWNQSYEIQEPIVKISENYVTVAEKKGNKIYIIDESGVSNEIKTNYPIQKIDIANQGTIAVLMGENGTGHIQLYAKDGTVLAGGEIQNKKGGFPLDIAISKDGKKVTVSMIDMSEGALRTTLAFYDFGSAGKNELDNMVGSFSYVDTIIPSIEFITKEKMVAFCDNKMIIYDVKQQPNIKKEIEVSQEIRSIFYNDNYFSIVYANENKEENYGITIYDIKGTKVQEIDFTMEYEAIEFLQNDEICIRSDMECEIFTLRGIKKFHSNFDKNIWKVISTKKEREYIFLLDSAIERIKLR